MSYSAAALIVLLSAGLTAWASRVVAGRVSLDTRRRHQDVGSVVFLQLGVVYAVLLAFVFSDVWGEYNNANQSINAECGDLHGAAMVAHSLADGSGAGFQRAVAGYLDTVVRREWPSMRERRASVDAMNAVQAMLDAAARLPAASSADATLRSQILSLLAAAHEQRETRLFQMIQGVPVMLWLLMILFTTILAGFVVFAGIEFRLSHLLLAAAFAGCTALVLVMIRMLDYPFEGALALRPTDFQTTLAKVVALLPS